MFAPMTIPHTQTGYGFVRGLPRINSLDNIAVQKPGPPRNLAQD